MSNGNDLPAKLNDFDPAVRKDALSRLLAGTKSWPAEVPAVNLHMHSFHSFNGEGWSPSRIAWEARQRGLAAAGLVDFDVLTGLEEWFAATDRLELRAAAGFESRVFLPEFAEEEVNSPGEPGVVYFMGFGFQGAPAAGSATAERFEALMRQAHQRNRELIARIAPHLGGLRLDYEKDVLPLTPAQNVTERHLVRAYYEKALHRAEGQLGAMAEYWAGVFRMAAADVLAKAHSHNAFLDFLRAKLMKQGGLGYVQPGEATFPKLDEVARLILDCQALPMLAWLNGLSAGERDPDRLLDCAVAKGVAAVGIIPDRNWNVKDPAERARKVQALHEFVKAAEARDLPVNVGTELNAPGQRFVDDFSAAELRPLIPGFLRGAEVFVGQTRLLRHAGYSYVGQGASDFPARKARNDFFATVGTLPAPDAAVRSRLERSSPAQNLDCLRASAKAGRWWEG